MLRHAFVCRSWTLIAVVCLVDCSPNDSEKENGDSESGPISSDSTVDSLSCDDFSYRTDDESDSADTQTETGDDESDALDASTKATDEETDTQLHSKPNIVFIFADDMGYSDIEPFGSTISKTPNLNRLADEGLKLTDFYVSAIACSPSRSALLTGSYANRIGMDGRVCFPNEPKALNPDEITIAEMLHDAGYSTGCFGKWHVGHEPGYMPLDQGFDEYVGIPYSNDMWTGKPNTDYPELPLMSGDKAIATILDARDQSLITERVTAAALDFIERHATQPFFAYIPFSLVHYPRYVMETKAEKADYVVQRAVVEEIDTNVGRIVEKLEALGIAENTLVFFTSDNGGLGETTTAPLRGWKAEIARYEGNVRVPTVAWWPGTIPDGTVTAEIGQTIDILPTLAKLTGAQVPTDRTIDGRDLSEMLFHPQTARSPHSVLFYEYTGVRKDNWKLVKLSETEYELYDLDVDIGESNNIASEYPDKVDELKAFLDKHIECVESDLRPRAEMPDLTPIPTAGLPRLSHLMGFDYLDVYPEDVLFPIEAESEKVDDRDAVNLYSGEWVEHDADWCHANTCSVAATPGASVAYTFDGTGISWYGAVNEDLGIARVYIDNVFAATVDCYSPNAGAQQLFTKSDLTEGEHTIEIVRAEEKNPLSSGYDIAHVYFERFWLQ